MYIGGTRQKRIALIVFLAPAIFSLVLFYILPIASSLVLSLLEYDPLRPASDIKFVGLKNFIEYFKYQDMREQYLHVLYYLVLYIPLVLVTSTMEAVMLNRAFKAKTLYKVLLYLPVITSWVAVALIWRWLLHGEYGIINIFLRKFGIQGPSWLHNKLWAMPGVVMAAVWKDTGYYALIILAALKGIEHSYYEAARIDGASAFKQFRYITLPLVSPTIFLLLVINVIAGFQVFESIYVMTEGGPAGATRVPVEQVYRNAFTYYKMGYASAIAWVLGIVIIIATIIQFRMEKLWVSYES
ncbi:MAG: sugar ABC transporter permease [Sphaerochaetaceae bacterium]|jgi:multiple sugar transport system permease protein|nr:sugar ABC transporter permease [Sphaerochaetaceae bacterium]